MAGSPQKNMKRAIQRRIAAVRNYRIQHGLDKFPEEVDLDRLAPGTARLVVWNNDDASIRKMVDTKAKQGGLLGVQYRFGRFRACLMGKEIGRYATAAEAAEAFNEAARKRFGDRAVLCDMRAARRFEERMTG